MYMSMDAILLSWGVQYPTFTGAEGMGDETPWQMPGSQASPTKRDFLGRTQDAIERSEG